MSKNNVIAPVWLGNIDDHWTSLATVPSQMIITCPLEATGLSTCRAQHVHSAWMDFSEGVSFLPL